MSGPINYSVIIRGPLGVGKSTVSEALARAIGGRHIPIDRILEANGIEEWDADRISLASFLKANGIAVEEARPAYRLGIPAIFDGCFYWREQLDDLRKRVGDCYVFTLKAPLNVCVERDRTRPLPRPETGPRGGDQQGRLAAEAVFRLVSEVQQGIPIDATGEVAQTVSSIIRHLPSSGSSD